MYIDPNTGGILYSVLCFTSVIGAIVYSVIMTRRKGKEKTTPSKFFAFAGFMVFVVGAFYFPFQTVVVDNVIYETAPAFDPTLAWISLFAFITLFIRGNTRGWWWIGASALQIVGLVEAWFHLKNNIAESARQGFIGVTIEDVLSGNTPAQTVESITFNNGFYISVFGLLLLLVCGIWDLTRIRKQQSGNIASNAFPQGTSNTKDSQTTSATEDNFEKNRVERIDIPSYKISPPIIKPGMKISEVIELLGKDYQSIGGRDLLNKAKGAIDLGGVNKFAESGFYLFNHPAGRYLMMVQNGIVVQVDEQPVIDSQ